MSPNEIAALIVSTIILLVFPPALYADNKFGATIRAWLPDQNKLEHFIMSAGFTAVTMAAIATITVFFEDTRSVSAVLFLSAVVTLGIALAAAEADEHRFVHLLIHGVYTPIYSIAGVALLYAYGFNFAVDTPWVLTAVFSSLVLGVIVGGLMTTTDPDEEEKLQNALVAFVALAIVIFGFCMMAMNITVGLLVVGAIVTITGIIQFKTKDPWAKLTLPIGVILLIASAMGFYVCYIV